MRSRLRFALLFAPSLALAWSCASAPPELPTSDLDPTLPEVDASPRPKKPPPTPIEAPDDLVDAGGDPAPSDLTISEVMFDPAGPEPASEWIEVWNRTSSARSLTGLTLKDGAGRTHAIAGDVELAPDAYAVLARDRAAAIAEGVPGEVIVYEYGAKLPPSEGIQLANGASGAIALVDGETELASVAYGSSHFAPLDGGSAQPNADGAWTLAAPTPGRAPTR